MSPKTQVSSPKSKKTNPTWDFLGLGSWDLKKQFYQNLSFPRAVEFAKINALPATEQKFAVFERNCDGRADQAGFEMRVGIMFEMAKAFVVLRNRIFQKKLFYKSTSYKRREK